MAERSDSRYCWVVVLISFLTHAIADGVSFSFGVLVPSLVEQFEGEVGRGHVAGLGALMIGVFWGAGPVASSLSSCYGYRVVAMAGALMASFGYALTAFIPFFPLLFLTFGVIAGLGLCLVYLPAVVMVSLYFDKRRSLATGLAVCGSGVGTFIFAPLTQSLLDQYGWRGALLLHAAFLLQCAVLAALYRPPPVPGPDLTPRSSSGGVEDGETTCRGVIKLAPSGEIMLDDETKKEQIEKDANENEIYIPDRELPRKISVENGAVRKSTCNCDNNTMDVHVHVSQHNTESKLRPENYGASGEYKNNCDKADTMGSKAEDGLDQSGYDNEENRTDGNQSATAGILVNDSDNEFDHCNGEQRTGKYRHLSRHLSSSHGDVGRLEGNFCHHHHQQPYHHLKSGLNSGAALSLQHVSGDQPTVKYRHGYYRPSPGSQHHNGIGSNINSCAHARFRSHRELGGRFGSSVQLLQLSTLLLPQAAASSAGHDVIPSSCSKDVTSEYDESSLVPAPHKSRFGLDWHLLRDSAFLLFAASNLLSCVSASIPYILLPDLAALRGVEPSHAAFLVSVLGISNTVTRVVFGLLADYQCVRRLLLYSSVLLIAGLATLPVVQLSTYPLLVTYSFLFGGCIGIYACLLPVVLIDLFSLEKLSHSFGLILLSHGLGAVAGPPVAGWLYDITGSYSMSFYFTGVVMALSGLILYPLPCLPRRDFPPARY